MGGQLLPSVSLAWHHKRSPFSPQQESCRRRGQASLRPSSALGRSTELAATQVLWLRI
jgi:hypothetical protein